MKILSALLLILSAIMTSSNGMAQPVTDQPGFYKINLGNVQVIALSDGTVPIDATKLLMPGQPEVLLSELEKHGLDNPVEISINAYLIISGAKKILVDAGSGELFKPNGGLLLNSLRAAGYRPEQVTDVLITHVHVDHTGGLTKQGLMVFPNAIIHVNQKELDFWSRHERPATGDTRGITANRPSYLALKPYLATGKVQPFTGNTQLMPGIATLERSGHTAGHTLYQLETARQKMIFWGDLVHIEQVQFQDALIRDEFDFDKAKAANVRQQSYAEFAKDGCLIAADHISFPGIGRMVPAGKGYRWVPIPYSVLGRVR